MKIKPKQIIIETTSRCNLRCKMCPSLTATEAMDMKVELLYSIIDKAKEEVPNAVIIPWMNGEPLLRKDYADIIKYISKQDLKQYITTNGTIWNEDFFQHITDDNSTVYQIIFSLDGLYENTIKGGRPGTVPGTVLSNIERFLRLKEKKQSNIDIGIKICHRGQDYEEIEQYIARWLSDPAVDYVCVGSALQEINEKPMRNYPCQYFDNNFMVIRADGRTTICAYNLEAANDPKKAVGQLVPGSSLLDVYNNSAYEYYRHQQKTGNYPPPCDTCGFAYTGDGMRGKVFFRNPELNATYPDGLFYHNDYYNQFYSLKNRQKTDTYYGYKGEKDE